MELSAKKKHRKVVIPHLPGPKAPAEGLSLNGIKSFEFHWIGTDDWYTNGMALEDALSEIDSTLTWTGTATVSKGASTLIVRWSTI